MKIHEYQGKEILSRFGVPVPRGRVAESADEARVIAKDLGGGTVVVKAQIHAGGRGKGGGVKVVKGPDAAAEAAKAILGMRLVTYQTGPGGQVVGRVLVEEGLQMTRELYLGLVIDRSTQRPVLMVSQEGGVEIEKVAAETPEKIFKAFIDPALGLQAFQARQLAFGLGLIRPRSREGRQGDAGALPGLCRHGRLAARDQPARRHCVRRTAGARCEAHLRRQRALSARGHQGTSRRGEEEPLEIEASKFSLNYIKLDGTIGCMVNGAGLAMATMDIIKLAGGEPANFLDVGGGANAEQIKNAFRILMSDKNVKAVLINIFGGILRCDVLAQGVIAAVTDLGVRVPIVIRMEGTNVETGQEDACRERPQFHDGRHDGRGRRARRRAWARSPRRAGAAVERRVGVGPH